MFTVPGGIMPPIWRVAAMYANNPSDSTKVGFIFVLVLYFFVGTFVATLFWESDF
jgi:hypothetical protein